MKTVFLFILMAIGYEGVTQVHPGVIIGTVMDEKSKALEGSTVQLEGLQDSSSLAVLTDKDGAFSFTGIPFGYYRLKFSYVGLQTLTLDSINLRAERYDFNLNEIVLKASAEKLEEVIIYAEKPLVQSKDGNITFNAGESALSAGSNASELLTNVPLVTKDPSGKLLVRGKEPKVLIDDKPVELNQQQLQDLLESMPGSSIEKIEVMTNPPPQYAGEQGGVINIVTRRGTVGMNGRISVYGGTRGEAGMNGSFNYRKQGFSLNINAGMGWGSYEGEGYSHRQNIYTDSTNYFNTESGYTNESLRPNVRVNMNYDPNKLNSFNIVLFYNGNDFNNRNITAYRNLNKDGQLYRYSERFIRSTGNNYNPNATFSYTHRTKRPGESLRLISSVGLSPSANTRDFYQQFLNPDGSPNGYDSTQQQVTDNYSRSYNVRLSYDVPLSNHKSFFSLGSYYTLTQSDIQSNAAYLRKTDNAWVNVDALANDFRFSQYITNLRASMKQVVTENFSTTVGVNAEQTRIRFDLYKTGTDAENSYWSYLPFATISRNWKEKLNLSFSYRRTIRRPGINALNPTIDLGDPYNIRYGNPFLLPSPSHNFDLVLGKSKTGYYINLGMGYNLVDDIFAQVRTLQEDGKTHTTWENISGRKEYEISTWSGYTVSRKFKVNLSASYTYNEYSNFDKEVRKYRNGGSITSNFNANYNLKDLYSATGSFTFNRFANPQGTVSSTLSMNIGLQAKLMKKKMTLTLNVIDPFLQQENRSSTYGKNFIIESLNATQTRNFRLSLGYSFSKKQKKSSAKTRQQVSKAVEKVKAGQ